MNIRRNQDLPNKTEAHFHVLLANKCCRAIRFLTVFTLMLIYFMYLLIFFIPQLELDSKALVQ